MAAGNQETHAQSGDESEAEATRNFLERLTSRLDQSKRSSAVLATLASLVAGGAVAFAGYLLLHELRDAYFTVQFATTNDRLAAHVAGDGDALQAFTLGLQDAESAQWRGAAFAIVWGSVGSALLATFWKRCWYVGPALRPIVLKTIALLPLAGAGVALIEKALTLIAIDGDENMTSLGDHYGTAIVSLAWAKWVLAGATVLAVIAMLVAAMTGALQRGLKKQEDYVATVVPPRSGGIGVSCSGGGIRAAGFSLGALSALEQWPADWTPGSKSADTAMPNPVDKLADSVLGQANYLSSVSGGGYAASAWRIAAGTDKQRERFARMPPIIGNPFELDLAVPTEPTNLLEHVRRHRSFLATGRGGLPLAAIRYALQTTFHITLLLSFVMMLTWPLGLLLRSWAIGGLNIIEGSTGGSIEFGFGAHQWIPPLIWACAAAVPWLLRLGTVKGSLRVVFDALTSFFALLAAGSALILIGLPWLVVNVNLLPEDSADQLQATGVYAVGLTVVWQFAKRFLERQAKYLGGVLLAVGIAIFALRVVQEAALETPGLGRLRTYVIVSLAVVAAFVFANPDKWSLSDFYRKRLAGTFVTELNETTEFNTATNRDEMIFHPSVLKEDRAPRLSDYIGAPGPEPIVCCAASRQDQTETGVAALSMTFEPDRVTVHGWSDDKTKTTATKKSLSHVEFKQRLPHGQQGQRLASLIGAAAISGAAVAPSMGRMNLKTTNALLAAFNARLGVWVPNPAHKSLDRMAAPRVINMFKEIFGTYGATDPNVYATDGGHWENLGLVELVRKRCDSIIAIDTSGDLPGTYKAFKEAIGLAFLECEAVVTIDEEAWQKMVPDEDGLVPRNFAIGTIRYKDLPGEPEGHTADLLYVKAAVSRTTPLAIQRYAAGDRTFPNYSTINQMLTDAQLTNLFKLGFASMQTALLVRETNASDAELLPQTYRTKHAAT